MKRILSSLLLGTLVSLAATASDWPQWRGPGGLGISEEKNLPERWSETENVRWKTAIPGHGHSSPVVWGDRLFVTAAVRGPKLDSGPTAVKHMMGGKEFQHPQWAGSDHTWTFKVFGLDRESGRLLWDQTAYQGKVYDHIHEQGSYAAPTPVTDGNRIWVYFGAEGLYCYDLDGRLLWKTSLGEIGTFGMGVGTSPVLYENLIILVCDLEMGDADSFITAREKTSGKEVWKVGRKARSSWATPLLVKTSQRDELVVSGAENVISYDPSDGRELWRAPGLVSHAIPSPVSDGKVVYLSAGAQAKRSMAVRLGGSGDLSESAHILWKYNKGAAYVPSPIYYDGHFYLLSDRGVVTCLNAKTGEVVYQERLEGSAAFKASPVAADAKLFISNQDGDTYVVKAGPVFEVLSTNSIGEPLWASPALAEGTIYLRGKEHLFAIAQH